MGSDLEAGVVEDSRRGWREREGEGVRLWL